MSIDGRRRRTRFMLRALELASLARGRTSPNPMVGALVVKNGDVIGEGYHARAGESHAEIRALDIAATLKSFVAVLAPLHVLRNLLAISAFLLGVFAFGLTRSEIGLNFGFFLPGLWPRSVSSNLRLA